MDSNLRMRVLQFGPCEYDRMTGKKNLWPWPKIQLKC